MLILLAAYLGGVLTILSPCILPVLPFVFARSGRSFRSHALPMLLGLALAFALAATLATVAAAWVETASEVARHVALTAMAVFGLALWSPRLADRMSRPLVALGARLSEPGRDRGAFGSLLLGLGTGLLWTPCAGPILGLLLTGAALERALTPLMLLAYALGACTSLAIALRVGGRIAAALKRSLHAGEWLRRGAGAAVLVAVASISLGLDTRVLARTSFDPAAALEERLVAQLDLRGNGSNGPRALSLPVEGTLPSLDGAVEWINGQPLTREALRGKVVLVDFWTYSCINCLRTLPYVRAWADKYRDQGLVVIGVHTPEFAFERKSENVRRAVKDLHIGYPVAVDSRQQIWRAFDNQYWPALYFVDAQGRIRHHVFGEGDYARSERVIQQLLREAGSANVAADISAPTGSGTQAAPGDAPAYSQETYLGRAQARGFVASGRPESLRTNQWTLAGPWRVDAEAAALEQPGGRIAYRFRARDLHLVLGIANDAKPVRFRVSIDGHAPGADHGADTDAQGFGTIDGHRLYQLVRQRAGEQDRVFEIEFLDTGALAYAFTFG